MSNHDVCLSLAIDRDIEERERLDHFRDMVARWLDELAPELADLRHPDIRWQPDDLAEALRDQLKSVNWERARLSGGAVIVERS